MTAPRTGPEVAAGLGLVVVEVFPRSVNWVARVRTPGGAEAVLKVAGADDVDLAREARVLSAFGREAAVAVLDVDPAGAWLQLESLRPGTPLTACLAARVPTAWDDDAATAVLVDVARRLHVPHASGYALPRLEGQCPAFEGYLGRHPEDDGPLPNALVHAAAGRFAELTASAPASVVLHGDLHHDNVLLADDGRGAARWRAIDPHGVVGDPGYEYAAMLYNPWLTDRSPALVDLVHHRLDLLAELVDPAVAGRERLAEWAFVKAVLSEVWSDEASTVPTTGPTRGPRTRAGAVAVALAP